MELSPVFCKGDYISPCWWREPERPNVPKLIEQTVGLVVRFKILKALLVGIGIELMFVQDGDVTMMAIINSQIGGRLIVSG